MSFAIGEPQLVARRLADALGGGASLDDDTPQPEPASPYVGTDASGIVCVDVPVERWHEALQAARERFVLDFFDWLSAVDQMDADPPGIDVVVHLVCSTSGGDGIGASAGLVRMMLRTRVPASALRIASVTDLWPGAAWHERETHEMFGLAFDGFDDGTGRGLRPLLLPDGFEGTPLRKSFILAARASKAWPGAKEPGESDAHAAPARRKMLPPGVPEPAWGPRDA